MLDSQYFARASLALLACVVFCGTGCEGQINDPSLAPTGGLEDPNCEGEECRAVSCNGSAPAVAPLRRLTDHQFRNVVRDLFRGVVRSDDLVWPEPNPGLSASGYSTEAVANETDGSGVEQMAEAADTVALRVVANIATLLPCGTPSADRSCAQEFLDIYGSRSFRRPLSAEENEAVLAIFDEASSEPNATFEDGLAMMVTVLLQSAPFLYQVELGVPEGDGVVRLTDYELAARLSFLFWDSMPDDLLFQAANEGRLQDPAERAAQAARMIADPSADETLSRFFREWSHVDRLEADDKSDEWFPEFTPELAASMDREFDRFVAHLVRDGGDFESLYTSNETLVDPLMADFFGVAMSAANEPVALNPDTRSAGILARPALLAGLAHQQRTSYVERGVFVLSQALCLGLGTPPADALSNEPDFPPNATPPETSALRRQNGTCAGCHDVIDPIGLIFEEYDAIGRHRDTWPSGAPIEPRGALPASLDVGGDVQGLTELGSRLAQSEVARECLSRQVFRFSFGRLDAGIDECSVQEVFDRWGEQAFRLDALLIAVTQTEAFASRRLEVSR